jgi:hypothetical protein
MSIVRNRNALQYFVHSLLICAALICGPRQTLPQTTGSSGEQAREPESVSDSSPSSNQSSEGDCMARSKPPRFSSWHGGRTAQIIGRIIHLELARRGTLPPWLQKRLQPCPEDLERRLPPPHPDCAHVLIGGHIVLLIAQPMSLWTFSISKFVSCLVANRRKVSSTCRFSPGSVS